MRSPILFIVIILDVRLPDGTGFDWCRKIRQLGMHQPIIMLTVRSDEVDKILGLEMGADDYVTKPYSFRELLSRIKAQFRRAYGEFAAQDSNLIYVGDVVIDRQRGIVLRDDQEIYLTPIEFRLFVYLAQNPNQALSRAQIMDAVWGHDATTESERSINSHIRRLREKVEIDPSNPTTHSNRTWYRLSTHSINRKSYEKRINLWLTTIITKNSAILSPMTLNAMRLIRTSPV